jgi:hypothetical protein
MCTPQIQQAIAGAQAAGIIPGQQISPEEAMASAKAGAATGKPQFDPQQLIASGQLGAGIGATASRISELFDPRTGQRISQVGPAVEMPMVPISREEFDEEGPVHMMHSQINSIPRAPMPRVPMPMYIKEKPIQRAPTVGELLGIPPGSVQEVGGPGRF